jgi:hypothetical protein
MPNRFTLAILSAAIFISPVTAQMRGAGSGMAGFGIRPGIGTGGVGASSRFRQGHAFERRSIFLSYPYFYSDSDYASGEVSQPQVVVVQALAPAVPPAPRESLLIEWQGDRFVRTTMSAKASAGTQIAPDYAEKSASPLATAGRSVQGRSTQERSAPGQSGLRQSVPGQKSAVQPPRDLPPAVLVFHDGRKEEVSEYTIMSGTIYSKADYWTTGSWTRKIQIADLDVPATLKLNQERGANFSLPASANEVVIRP